jgi:hypothetical protein
MKAGQRATERIYDRSWPPTEGHNHAEDANPDLGRHLRGMGDARSGPQLSRESGPDFMMLMSSSEYGVLLINEFVIQRLSFGFLMRQSGDRISDVCGTRAEL